MSEAPVTASDDNICFFVTPIGSDGSDTRRRSDLVYDYIVRPAAEELGLEGMRADRMDSPGQITTQVMERVLQSRLVVADLTGSNPNVFYEMAVRHSTAKPMVLISDMQVSLPFDVITMRTIPFDYQDLASASECRGAIVRHGQEALSTGLIETPISAAFNMIAAQSGSGQEQMLAQIMQGVESIGQRQRELETAVTGLDRQLAVTSSRFRSVSRPTGAAADAVIGVEPIDAVTAAGKTFVTANLLGANSVLAS